MRSVPISALEHWAYCPRQCALIHVEQTFDENVYTLRGARLHERVESGEATVEGETRVVRSIPLVSERWGLHGKADVVELGPAGPHPVEYKAGKVPGLPARVQLCGQVLCLEEMYGTVITRGSIFCGASRRRFEIEIDAKLREVAQGVIAATRAMLEAMAVPGAPDDHRCPPCSLYETCMPGAVSSRRRIAALRDALYRPLVPANDHA